MYSVYLDERLDVFRVMQFDSSQVCKGSWSIPRICASQLWVGQRPSLGEVDIIATCRLRVKCLQGSPLELHHSKVSRGLERPAILSN